MVDAQGVMLLPAIDLRRGRCVRLERGEAERETIYNSDPLRVAEDFARRGAEWLHVVDLDAAFGEGSNRAVIAQIAREFPLRVQTGGGLRSEADLEEVLASSVERAVIGTAAIEQPELVAWAVEHWGERRIAVGLDARGNRPAIRGWREDTGEDLFTIAAGLVELGVRTIIYTDIERDGMFSGPNLQMSVDLAERSGADVVVSGGISTIADLEAIADAARRTRGIVGAIVGKAIYERRFEVEEALAMLRA
ncbi:1-(5-phosphoribosyl)-5-[(5-phosphoribosylamino)methylideneamino]imidazole-4-carboxamide isomerase [soil metagenome]